MQKVTHDRTGVRLSRPASMAARPETASKHLANATQTAGASAKGTSPTYLARMVPASSITNKPCRGPSS